MKDLKRAIKTITEREVTVEEQGIKLYEKKLKLLSIIDTFKLDTIAEEWEMLSNKARLSNKLLALYEEVKIEVEEAKLKLQEIEKELLKTSEARQKSIDELAIEFDLANREANAKKENLFNHYNLKLDQLEVEHDKEFRRQHREKHNKRLTLSRFLDKYSIIFWSEIIEELKRLTIEEAIKSIKSLEEVKPEPKLELERADKTLIPDRYIDYNSRAINEFLNGDRLVYSDPTMSREEEARICRRLAKMEEELLKEATIDASKIIFKSSRLTIASNLPNIKITAFDINLLKNMMNAEEHGQMGFFEDDIMKFWRPNGRARDNKTLMRDVRESLSKLSNIRVYFQFTKEAQKKKYNDIEATIEGEPLLVYKTTTKIPYNSRKAKTYIELLRHTALYNYSKANNQKRTYEREILDYPVSLTKKTIGIGEVILRQIAMLNSTKGRRREVSMNFETIFAQTGIEIKSRQELQRTTGYIESILEHHKERKDIYDYKISGRGKAKKVTLMNK